jgi:glycosyltransferase involved in cell wall biosynthesis
MLSIIVPTRDKASRLLVCLEVLSDTLRNYPIDTEVIIVDDGSRDDTRTILLEVKKRFPASLRIIGREVAGGRSVARNAGALSSNGSYLLFLDDDVLISQIALERHWVALNENGTRTLVRGTILNIPWLRAVQDPLNPCAKLPERLAMRLNRSDINQSLIDQLTPYARRSHFEADLHRLLSYRESAFTGRWLAATGGNLSVSREFFEQLGGFDEQMGLRWGMEDLEFGFRAGQAGAQIIHLSDVIVYHMDHDVANRASDHQAALQYFGQKHGEELGRRLSEYFAGERDILEIGLP